jgi:hypothetical protein
LHTRFCSQSANGFEPLGEANLAALEPMPWMVSVLVIRADQKFDIAARGRSEVRPR